MTTWTKVFIGLIIAAFALLALAWYTYRPENTTVAVAPAAQGVSATSTLTGTVVSSSSTPVSPYPPPALGEGNGIITIGGQTIYADLAENPAQQALGLGNRASLGAHQGMLFLFPTDDIHEFWMKDMSFSIDMIWMSDDGTIIYIQPNVSPATYPEAFGPTEVSRYVLEVPANFAADNGIKVGDKATLP